MEFNDQDAERSGYALDPVYARVGFSEQSVGGSQPDGWIVMQYQRPIGDGLYESNDFTAQADGTWAVTAETLRAKAVVVEDAWRETQVPIILRQLEAIEENESADGDPELIPKDLKPGTAKQWLAYRTKVRAWKEGNVDFPDIAKRPTQPS